MQMWMVPVKAGNTQTAGLINRRAAIGPWENWDARADLPQKIRLALILCAVNPMELQVAWTNPPAITMRRRPWMILRVNSQVMLVTMAMQ